MLKIVLLKLCISYFGRSIFLFFQIIHFDIERIKKKKI